MAGPKQRFSLRRIILIRLVSLLGPLLVKLIGLTWKIDHRGEEELDKLRNNGERVLYAFWHNRILPLAYVYRNRGAMIMISQHGDGELIASVVSRMGYLPIRGSSTIGGMKAARELMMDGSMRDVAITPDGPRGPCQVAQPGAVYIASRGGFVLTPLAVEASSKWVLNSWDRFMIPKPFCHLRIDVGKPIRFKDKLDNNEIEEYSRILGDTLNKMTNNLTNTFQG